MLLHDVIHKLYISIVDENVLHNMMAPQVSRIMKRSVADRSWPTTPSTEQVRPETHVRSYYKSCQSTNDNINNTTKNSNVIVIVAIEQ